ncbi:tetraspanin [Calycina marina]|uniref:Tetraspanin n=1 Tax=Calycina marina TaxID=1763456 RepID=A0A9P7Z9Y6_9HELO|nr:tetraspanin [Calycina marina]
MARDNVLLAYIASDLLFVAAGGLLIIFALIIESYDSQTMTVSNVARNLILGLCPAKAVIGNAVLIFVTFLLSIPAMVIPTMRGILKMHGYLVTVCAFFTMVLGLILWFETLEARTNLEAIFLKQSSTVQSLIQAEFQCCGYKDASTIVFDTTCPNSVVAASLTYCVTPFTSYGNNFLDLVFTGAFGIVGIDTVLIVMTAILLKDRKEKERYAHIDQKQGPSGI